MDEEDKRAFVAGALTTKAEYSGLEIQDEKTQPTQTTAPVSQDSKPEAGAGAVSFIQS